MSPPETGENRTAGGRFRPSRRLAIVAAATTAGVVMLYVLFSFTQLALLASGTPNLPTSGIVATASGGESMIGDDDVLVGRLRLADGCLTVVPDEGELVVPVFPPGATLVDGELTEMKWKDDTYAEGDRVELVGEIVGPISALPSWHEGYYLPSGCLDGNQFFVVNNLPD